MGNGERFEPDDATRQALIAIVAAEYGVGGELDDETTTALVLEAMFDREQLQILLEQIYKRQGPQPHGNPDNPN